MTQTPAETKKQITLSWEAEREAFWAKVNSQQVELKNEAQNIDALPGHIRSRANLRRGGRY